VQKTNKKKATSQMNQGQSHTCGMANPNLFAIMKLLGKMLGDRRLQLFKASLAHGDHFTAATLLLLGIVIIIAVTDIAVRG
jgi:hypothetical protein